MHHTFAFAFELFYSLSVYRVVVSHCRISQSIVSVYQWCAAQATCHRIIVTIENTTCRTHASMGERRCVADTATACTMYFGGADNGAMNYCRIVYLYFKCERTSNS